MISLDSFIAVAEVWRNDVIESVHGGVAAVANADGDIIYSFGDPSYVTFPRSSLKPVQALLLIESGAFEAARLTERHLAIACASHRGEPIHGKLVREWLRHIDLKANALACGPTYPRTPELAYELVRQGEDISQVWHNCSGKHCGFLTSCKHMRWPIAGYAEPDHPAQLAYLDILSELLGSDAHQLPMGKDECTLPAAALSIQEMAKAMGRFAAARSVDRDRADAMKLIHSAMRRYPEYVSGTGQLTQQLITATEGRVIAKNGAEGFLVAMVPDQGLGIAVKIADGSPRARGIVMTRILIELGLLDEAQLAVIPDLLAITVNDSRGNPVGSIKTAELPRVKSNCTCA